MASTISAIKCPHCGRSAIEDLYYKTDEQTIVCYRCGYYYSRRIEDFTASPVKYGEEKCKGHGVFIVTKKDGHKKVTLFNGAMTQGEIDEYHKELLQDDIEQENSLLVTYEEGVFTIHCGTPSENFHLPFEQYKIKMLEKYGDDDYNEHFVPIEE